MDAALGGFVLSERIEGDAVEHREVLRGMASAFAVQVLAEADIEHPMQFVLDAPVLANGCIQPLCIGPQAGDVVADFALCFAGGRIDGWWGVSRRLRCSVNLPELWSSTSRQFMRCSRTAQDDCALTKPSSLSRDTPMFC